MVTMTAPLAFVAAPARTPLAFGLGSVIAWRPDGDRWEAGVQWESITCDGLRGRGGPGCAEPDEEIVGLPKPLDEFAGPIFGDATPFVVYGESACSVIGGGGLDAGQARAEAHLLAREEARAEQAFWTGDLGNTPNLSGANGYPAPFNLPGSQHPWEALAEVESWMGSAYGSNGVIHMGRGTASLLLSKGSLDVRGGRLWTELGTPVVAGAGYPEGVIVGTPSLIGYRGEVFTSSAIPGDLLDRADNTLYAIAEREYLIGMDPCGTARATFSGQAPSGGDAPIIAPEGP